MSLAAHLASPFDFNWLQQMVVVNGAVGRLLTACLLGALIGLEREVKRKAGGCSHQSADLHGRGVFHAAFGGAGGRCQSRQGAGGFEHRAGNRISRRWTDSAQSQPRQRADQCGQCLGGCIHRHGVRRGTLCGRGGGQRSSWSSGAGTGGISGAARKPEGLPAGV